MKVESILNPDVATLSPGTSLADAAQRFRESRANDLMVTDDNGTFVGVLSEGDFLRSLVPDFEALARSGQSLVDAYAAFHRTGRERRDTSIDSLVIKDAITIDPGLDVLEAVLTMDRKHIRRLPVVKDGKLLGTISRADICFGLVQD